MPPQQSDARASTFSTQNCCEALFEHSIIHQKGKRGAKKINFFGLRRAKHVDVMAACILMGIRRSECEADIDDAKLCKLKWICAEIERKIKMTKEVAPPLLSTAVGDAVVKKYGCDQCNKTFNSGQALGGHKRAHYIGPPLYHLGTNVSLSAAVIAQDVEEMNF